MNEVEALVFLTHTPKLGPVKIRMLIEYFGSALHVLAATLDELACISGIGPILSKKIKEGPCLADVEKDLHLCSKMGVTLLSFQDTRYPKRLLDLHDAPPLLYVKGSLLEEQEEKKIAVVGTRNASIYGTETAEKICSELAEYGFCVTSGLARGIDTAAHKGALQNGRTIAVIGSGLAHIYPQENVKLAQAIAENGAVVSELPTFFPPAKEHFPKRNRIVSGMSLASVLIEAPLKSGAMITMDLAEKLGRKLFALPGRVDNENFKGNHSLLKSRKAHLLENTQDILLAFHCNKAVKEKKGPEWNKSIGCEERELLLKMSAQEISIEELSKKTSFSISKLNALLISLILKNIIKEFPGKLYKIRESFNG